MSNLSELLKSKRQEKKMGLRDFAAFLGISHAYLDKLEKGVDPRTGKEIKPSVEVFNKIASALNIPKSEFSVLCGYVQSNGFGNGGLGKEEGEGKNSFATNIEDYINNLRNMEGLMFQEEPVGEEALDSIVSALIEGMKQVDMKNKRTRKSQRGEDAITSAIDDTAAKG